MAREDLLRLVDKLWPQVGGEDVVRWRTGVVDAVNVDGTLDVAVSGVVIPDMFALRGVSAGVGDIVHIAVYRGMMIVLGGLATDDSFTVNGDLTVGGTSLFEDTVTISPPAGAGSKHIQLNEGYSVYADNTGTGSANSRLWLDTPDDGEVVIGPRSGSAHLESLRLRTDATTASAANCFIDATTQQIRRSTSSARYKERIRDADLDLEAVLRLRSVRFKDKDEFARQGDNARDHVGFIAEEVDALGLREFVYYNESEEPESVQYDRVVVALVDLVRNLTEEVATLRDQVLGNGGTPNPSPRR